jgi:DNA primase
MFNDNRIVEDIKRIPILDVVQALGGLGLNGKLQGDCPTGHDSENHKCFSIDVKDNIWSCFHCNVGRGSSVIDLVMVVENKTFPEALAWFGENFNINGKVHKTVEANPVEKVNLEEIYAKDALYSLIFEKGKELLYTDIGKIALDYLVEARGYAIENLKESDWIYFPSDKEIRVYLLKMQPDAKAQIAKLGLQGAGGDNFRLAFPYRNRDGFITGFVKRATEPKGITIGDSENVRYDSTKGLTKDDLFNLCNCREYKELLIVEGYPDALYLPTLDFKNIVAIGQGALGVKHVDGLKALGIAKVTICLDNDKAGIENTPKAVEKFKDSGIQVYTMNPTLMGAHKDPDEFVKANGIEAFIELYEGAELQTDKSSNPVTEKEAETKKDKKKGDSQATILVKLCQKYNVELWHTKDKQPMATFLIDKHYENWTTNSKTFKEYLQRLYFENYKTAPGKSAIIDAIGVIDGLARWNGVEKEVFTRLAYVEDKIYLDLCNDTWQVIEIDSIGWRVLDVSPIAFRRGRGMLALPIPTQQGNISALFDIFYVEAKTQALILACLIGAMNQKGPFPILVFNGEQGSGKSTLCSLFKNILDPGMANLKSIPREERDLIISASNSWILSYDNISGFPEWISDAMCRLSTGGGISIRELYSDSEEMIFDVKRPIVLNGIENIGLRSDFADRTILISLPKIEKRLDEKSMKMKFAELHPIILGGLCDATAMALKNIDTVKLDNLPRMADFALWITASEQALGVKNLVDLYQENRDEQSAIVLGASVVGTAIMDFMTTRTFWEGTLKQLLDELDTYVDVSKRREKSYPKDATRLSGKLRRDAKQLRDFGIYISFGEHSMKGNSVKLEKI